MIESLPGREKTELLPSPNLLTVLQMGAGVFLRRKEILKLRSDIVTYTPDKPGLNAIITPPLIYDAARLTSDPESVATIALKFMSAIIVIDKIIEQDGVNEIPVDFIDTVIARHNLPDSDLVREEITTIVSAMIKEKSITEEMGYKEVAEIMKKSNGFGAAIRILAAELRENDAINTARYVVDQFNWALRLLTDIRTSGKDKTENAQNNMVVQYMKKNKVSHPIACLSLHAEAASSIYNMYSIIIDKDELLNLDSLRFAYAMSARFHIMMKVYLGLKVGL